VDYGTTELNLGEWLAMKWMTSYKLNHIRTAVSGLTRPSGSTRVVYVFGCQRSGTTMLVSLLGLDPRARTYDDGDARYFYWDDAPRLRPWEDVRAKIRAERNAFTVLKPLCESQRAGELLAQTDDSRGIWIFRDYRGCVASHMKYYRQVHDWHRYIAELLNVDEPSWKNEHLGEQVVDLLRSKASKPLNEETGYALYWLARNSLVLGQPRQRLKLLCYEHLLREPLEQSAELFRFTGIPYQERYTRIIKAQPTKHADGLHIDHDVAERCETLYRQLLGTVEAQNVHERAMSA
jgi:hypothetical protein